MSLTAAQYTQLRKKESPFVYHLTDPEPLSRKTLRWMAQEGKVYSPETIERFRIYQARLSRLLKSNSRLVWCFLCIVIPVGPIFRCYVMNMPRSKRWYVVPTGCGAQWLGDLTNPELIPCEGEWDFLCLQDHGFTNAVTHTAGAGTWLHHWTALFKDKLVWLCYDRDITGQQGMAKAGKNIFAVAKTVKLVDLPLRGTPDSNDISDFFRLGGTPDEFRNILNNARLFIPKVRRARR